MIESIKVLLITTLSLSGLISQSTNDVYYVRYFESDHNFKADLSMLSTDRRGRSHLAVSFNEKDQPIKIERISSSGVTEKEKCLNTMSTGYLRKEENIMIAGSI